MRLSQYVHRYLSLNKKMGFGKGYTTGTYLTYTLQGYSREWSGRYRRSLENSCLKLGAIEGKSVKGGIAYYPKE